MRRSKTRWAMRRPHLLAIVSLVAVIVLTAALLFVTHFNLAAVIPTSMVIGAFSLAISQSLQDVFRGIVAGEELNLEGTLFEGDVIDYGGTIGEVVKKRPRYIVQQTARGRRVIPNNQLLTLGFELIDHPGETNAP